jgi:hypothetical protein
MAWFHMSPSKLLMAAAILKISEQNQNAFTISMSRNQSSALYICMLRAYRLIRSDFAGQVRSVVSWPLQPRRKLLR